MKNCNQTNTVKRVAIIGSQGVPPKYGGFETLVDNILAYADHEHVRYTVFCSRPDMRTDLSSYRGARLRYINLHAHGKSSVPYDIISMLKAIRGFDAILILGVSGCVFLPMLKLMTRARIIVNIDGLEHRRDKWQPMAKRFLKLSLDTCIRWADIVISDNKGIQDFVKREYGREAKLIAYGGDHALRDIDRHRQNAILDFYKLSAGQYDLSICRIEPENNVELTLRAYAAMPGDNIVIVGNWNHSDYSRDLYAQYEKFANIRMLESIYDADILYAIRNNTHRYVHGHRAGGTNPSLVEMMFFGKPILAFDVVYNRETTHGNAYYYSDEAGLKALLGCTDLSGEAAADTARNNYVWADIAHRYEALF